MGLRSGTARKIVPPLPFCCAPLLPKIFRPNVPLFEGFASFPVGLEVGILARFPIRRPDLAESCDERDRKLFFVVARLLLVLGRC